MCAAQFSCVIRDYSRHTELAHSLLFLPGRCHCIPTSQPLTWSVKCQNQQTELRVIETSSIQLIYCTKKLLFLILALNECPWSGCRKVLVSSSWRPHTDHVFGVSVCLCDDSDSFPESPALLLFSSTCCHVIFLTCEPSLTGFQLPSAWIKTLSTCSGASSPQFLLPRTNPRLSMSPAICSRAALKIGFSLSALRGTVKFICASLRQCEVMPIWWSTDCVWVMQRLLLVVASFVFLAELKLRLILRSRECGWCDIFSAAAWPDATSLVFSDANSWRSWICPLKVKLQPAAG